METTYKENIDNEIIKLKQADIAFDSRLTEIEKSSKVLSELAVAMYELAVEMKAMRLELSSTTKRVAVVENTNKTGIFTKLFKGDK